MSERRKRSIPSIAKLSRGRRTFGIIDLFGISALDQIVKTMVKDAEKFEAAFALGLSCGEIAEAPIAALDILRDKFKQGSISPVELEAKLTGLFPDNAAQAALKFVQASDDLVAQHEEKRPLPSSLTGAALEQIYDLILDLCYEINPDLPNPQWPRPSPSTSEAASGGTSNDARERKRSST